MANTTATTKLPELARQIARHESKLARLRHKLDSRLANLNRRREDLRSELRSVETEIEAVAQSGPQNEQTAAAPTPEPVRKRGRKRSGASLADFLVALVREGKGKPVPMATLKEQTVSRRFPTTSTNLPGMVEKRASELVQGGRLRRDSSTGGYLVSETRNGQGVASPKTSATPGRKKSSAQSKSSPTTGARRGRTPLRSVLLDLMKKSGRTMSAQELATQARQTGYRSKSRDFKNVVWVVLGDMPEVEHDPTGGYRLKKGQG
jgi:hypothetical protein